MYSPSRRHLVRTEVVEMILVRRMGLSSTRGGSGQSHIERHFFQKRSPTLWRARSSLPEGSTFSR